MVVYSIKSTTRLSGKIRKAFHKNNPKIDSPSLFGRYARKLLPLVAGLTFFIYSPIANSKEINKNTAVINPTAALYNGVLSPESKPQDNSIQVCSELPALFSGLNNLEFHNHYNVSDNFPSIIKKIDTIITIGGNDPSTTMNLYHTLLRLNAKIRRILHDDPMLIILMLDLR